MPGGFPRTGDDGTRAVPTARRNWKGSAMSSNIIRMVASDNFLLPKGTSLTWVVDETVRKFYMTAG